VRHVTQALRQTDSKLSYRPLNSDESFNIRVDMARQTAVKYIRPTAFDAVLPLGHGTFSEQETVEVAQHLSHAPGLNFQEKMRGWPRDKSRRTRLVEVWLNSPSIDNKGVPR
jgi:cytochrome c